MATTASSSRRRPASRPSTCPWATRASTRCRRESRSSVARGTKPASSPSRTHTNKPHGIAVRRVCSVRGALLLHRHFLHPEIPDLADVQRALAAAVDCVDGAELLQQLSRFAELTDHRAIEADLLDLAGRVDVSRRIRIRHIQHLIRPRRHADRLRVADALDLALERAVVVEHLDALIAGVSGVDVALRVNGDAVDAGEFAIRSAALSPGLDE